MNRQASFFFALIVAWALMPAIACAQTPNILFVGNSFTFCPAEQGYNSANVTNTNASNGRNETGGVAGAFQKMATNLGYSCNVSIEAYGGEFLSWHYANESAIIGQAKWNVVVLQDYSTEPTNPTNPGYYGPNVPAFNTAVGQLRDLIRGFNSNAKIYLYETWARPDLCSLQSPPVQYSNTYTSLADMLTGHGGATGLQYNYNTANATYGLNGVAPVGDAFALAISQGYADANPYNGIDAGKFNLWDSDFYHESPSGCYLAAAIFIAKITGLDPRNIPTSGTGRSGEGTVAADFHISASDAAHLNLLAYNITASAPTISNGPPPATGIVNAPYSFTYTATGSPASTFSVTSGTLPAGLSLSTSGVLSGTPSTAATYTGTVTANNGAGTAATQNFSITIQNPAAPTITSVTPPATGTIGTAYNFTYTFTGNPTPTFSVTSGTLPAGLSLSTAGVISGTTTTAATYTGTVTAANGTAPNATQNFSIIVQPQQSVAPTITSSAPPGGMVNTTYSFTYTASGYPASTFSVSAGTLPTGLTLSPTGTLSGAPTTAATFTGTVTAANGIAPNATKNFSIVVGSNSSGSVVKAINCGSSSNYTATDGTVYSADTYFTGGTAFTATTTITTGTDPLLYQYYRYGSPTPAVYNIPVSNGNYVVHIKYAEMNPGYGVGSRVFGVTVQGTTVESAFDIRAHVATLTPLDEAYNATVTNGTLSVGQIYLATNPIFSAIVVNNVVTQTAPSITNGPAPNSGTVGTAYGFTYTATGTPVPTFSVSAGTLPAGLSLSSTGVISGTPTTAATYTGTVTAANGIGTAATQNFSIVVAPLPVAPTITSSAPFGSAVGTSYNFTYTTSGTPAPTFSVSTGNLPSGLLLSLTGTISGTPTTAGTYTGTVTAANGVGTAATQNFSITIVGTFDQWASTYFTPQQLADPTNTSGPNATPQHDGVSNLLKYLFHIDPRHPMSAIDRGALPVVGMSPPYVTLVYRQNALLSGIILNVQISSDLQNWSAATSYSTQILSLDPNTGDPIIEIEVNANGASKEFVRLYVALPGSG